MARTVNHSSKKSLAAERSLIESLGDTKLSAFKKYQEVFVGENSFWELIKYEVLISLLSSFPGAGGLFLRSKLFQWVFK